MITTNSAYPASALPLVYRANPDVARKNANHHEGLCFVAANRGLLEATG
jgi:hypothetical protein